MKKTIAAAVLLFALALAPAALGTGMSVSGGKEKAGQNLDKTERQVEAGRQERDENTMRPLAPVYEFVVKALKESEDFMNSAAKAGSRARLLCDDKESGVSVQCSPSGTNRECVDKLYRVLMDMGYHTDYDYCKVRNPNPGWFQPDYISKHAVVDVVDY
jgi:hypothetical protein